MSREFLKQLVDNNEVYRGFYLYDKPEEFEHTPLFSDKYAMIQIHAITPDKNDIFGFVGACKVEGEDIVSLDGDSYTKHMTVVGYSEFKNDDGRLCLDLLVDKW